MHANYLFLTGEIFAGETFSLALSNSHDGIVYLYFMCASLLKTQIKTFNLTGMTLFETINTGIFIRFEDHTYITSDGFDHIVVKYCFTNIK